MSKALRYLHSVIQSDALALGKMAFISGPRQVGKTTLSKGLVHGAGNYFS
jgi:predicted AAA+ superfamily ATPase